MGALIILPFPRLNMRLYDLIMGFSGGIMLSIATLGLIDESLTHGGLAIAILGFLVGAGLLFAFDRAIPHLHRRLMDGMPLESSSAWEESGGRRRRAGRGWSHETAQARSLQRGVLIGVAIALHNLPEGFVVGVSYTAQPALGFLVAAAITLHNIPEGIAVAAPLFMGGMSKLRSVFWATLSGLVEPLAAILGAVFVVYVGGLVPLALALAGGAMVYVVSDEMIPESHSHGYEHEATLGLIIGFIVMMVLESVINH
jgi:ZIP family zinc transporter